MNLRRFVGNWSLPLAIIAGIISYFAIRFLYRELPAELAVYLPARRTVLAAVAVVQPALIFIMPPGAFLTFGLIMALLNKFEKNRQNKAKLKSASEKDSKANADAAVQEQTGGEAA